jgi:hypothetical protein
MPSWSDALQNAEQEIWTEITANESCITESAADRLNEIAAIRSTYGAVEVNPITDDHAAHREAASEVVDLADKRLARITRLRLVTDRDFPMWDLSYCYGVLKDSTPVRVRLPRSQFPKTGLQSSLVEMCKEVNVYGKGLGIFDPEVISKLYG